MNTIDGNEPPCPTYRHVPLAAATITAAGPTALAAASPTAATEPVAAVAPSLASNHSAFVTSTAAAARAGRGLLAAVAATEPAAAVAATRLAIYLATYLTL